jgi:DNA ligase D-like protein (predicted 3'-phosphoesterase)
MGMAPTKARSRKPPARASEDGAPSEDTTAASTSTRGRGSSSPAEPAAPRNRKAGANRAPKSAASTSRKASAGRAAKAPARPRAEDRSADQPLAEYHRKRDFSRTAEPAGAPLTAGGRKAAAEGLPPPPDGTATGRFVVQRHRARRLHYDLRFEIDGVLASWAVPKGPTLDPGPKRLAVRTEDHPIEYRAFECVIPAGEYGGGDVIV